MSASDKARKQQDGIIADSKPKVRKVQADDENSDFECYEQFDRQPSNVDVDEEVTGSSEKNWRKRLFRKNSEEEKVNNNGEMGVGNDSQCLQY